LPFDECFDLAPEIQGEAPRITHSGVLLGALDFAKKGIRINAVCPGFVDTPLVTPAIKKILQPNIDKTPMGRLAHVQEIADGIAFLASERASYITGTALTVDGGYTVH